MGFIHKVWLEGPRRIPGRGPIGGRFPRHGFIRRGWSGGPRRIPGRGLIGGRFPRRGFIRRGWLGSPRRIPDRGLIGGRLPRHGFIRRGWLGGRQRHLFQQFWAAAGPVIGSHQGRLSRRCVRQEDGAVLELPRVLRLHLRGYLDFQPLARVFLVGRSRPVRVSGKPGVYLGPSLGSLVSPTPVTAWGNGGRAAAAAGGHVPVSGQIPSFKILQVRTAGEAVFARVPRFRPRPGCDSPARSRWSRRCTSRSRVHPMNIEQPVLAVNAKRTPNRYRQFLEFRRIDFPLPIRGIPMVFRRHRFSGSSADFERTASTRAWQFGRVGRHFPVPSGDTYRRRETGWLTETGRRMSFDGFLVGAIHPAGNGCFRCEATARKVSTELQPPHPEGFACRKTRQTPRFGQQGRGCTP